MKKWIALLLALCLCCALLPASAEKTAGEIAGTWKMTKYTVGEKMVDDPEAAGSKKNIVFNEDGTAQVTINKNVYAATWTLEGDIIHLLYEDGDKGDFTVEPEQLVYKTGNQVQYFTQLHIISAGLGSVSDYWKAMEWYRDSLRGNDREYTQFFIPARWVEQKDVHRESGGKLHGYTDTAADPHYGVTFSQEEKKNYPETEDEIKASFDRLASRYPEENVSRVTVKGLPALMIKSKNQTDERNEDYTALYLFQGKALIMLSYNRILSPDESEELYTYRAEDILTYAEHLHFSEEDY